MQSPKSLVAPEDCGGASECLNVLYHYENDLKDVCYGFGRICMPEVGHTPLVEVM